MKWYLVNRFRSTTRSTVTYQSASYPLREHNDAGNEGHRLVLQIWTPLCTAIAVKGTSSTQTSHPTIEILPVLLNSLLVVNFHFCEHEKSCHNKIGNWKMNDIFEKFHFSQLFLWMLLVRTNMDYSFVYLICSSLNKGTRYNLSFCEKIVSNVVLLELRANGGAPWDRDELLYEGHKTIHTSNIEWCSV